VCLVGEQLAVLIYDLFAGFQVPLLSALCTFYGQTTSLAAVYLSSIVGLEDFSAVSTCFFNI